MGQQLFKINFEKIDSIETNDNFDGIRSCSEKDNITFLFPWKINHLLKNNNDQMLNYQNLLIKEIRNNLFQLNDSKHLKQIDIQINKILIEDVFTFIQNNYEKSIEQIKENLEKQKQLQQILIEKLKEEEEEDEETNSMFTLNENDDNHLKLSYFGIQSLVSILLILIESVEKNDSNIINQILLLTNQLSQQIPMRSLANLNNQIYLFKSIKPLINYIQQLTLSSNLIISKQATNILLNISIGKASFKDILPLLSKLIFDKNNIYYYPNLIKHLNNDIKEDKDEISLNYLKSIGSFPNNKLIKLNEKEFTGEFISSIILSHIDLNNQINLNNSFSFEFHPNIFKQLFNIIEQLTIMSDSNYIKIICVKLFRIHLKYLSDTTTNIYQNLLLDNHLSDIDFINNEELTKWFDLFLKLSKDNEEIICEEASKSIIYIIDKQTKSFIQKLSLIHKYIIQNDNQSLINQFMIELNREVILLNWIEVLSNNNEQDKLIGLNILFEFIQIYFKQNQKQIEQILISFQHLLLFKLIQQSKKENQDQINSISSLIIQYITYIFKNSTNQNQLFNEILVGLSLMTKIDEIFQFITIEPIFTAVLPLLSEYFLKNPTNNPHFICWLLGKMSQIMIINSPLNSLEKTYFHELNSPLFSGGYETSSIESSSDHELLISIYNNNNEGAKLISKIKMSLKTKQNLLQKSIEEQANDACASIFAVYIKYYRRINLVRNDLSRLDDEKVHDHLLSLYKYANSVEILFANKKGQGENCDEFYQQIKTKCLFLLLSIKENDLIPIIEIPEDKIHFKRQISHWTKAKHVIRLLRNLMNACIRFKKLILNKKQKIFNYENILHQSIENFIYQNKFNLEEFKILISRQQQRAIGRLIIYQFIQTFIQNNQNLHFYLTNPNLEYFSLQNISTANNQLKKDIQKSYFYIIKILLESSIVKSEIFNLLNINYQSDDFIYLFDYQIIQIILNKFVNFIENDEQNISLNLKFISFNWFRLFLFKFSKNIHLQKLKNFQNQTNFIFNIFILNQLKGLNQFTSNHNQDNQINYLQNFTFGWFIYSTTKKDHSQIFSSRFEIELCINQFLIILLECIYLYEHIRSICANTDYIEQLLNIYYQSKYEYTIIFTIKILSQLICYLPNNLNQIIEKFLIDSLNLIGEYLISPSNSINIINELINMFRIILSTKSSWQMITTQLIFNSINVNINEELIDINKLIASLSILGGYIQPFCVTSIVKVFNKKEINNKFQFGIIIEIDQNSSYVVQYLETNQIETVNIDQLEIEIDVSPPNLLLLPNSNELIDSIFDKLGDFIQIDTNSNFLLQIKRRSICALYHLLNNQKLIQIFMEKPYASILAKLTMSNSIKQPINLSRLEQYYLNLRNDDNQEDVSSFKMNRDENLVNCLSTSVWKYNGWKPFISKNDFQLLNQGRLGNNEMLIVPMPLNAAKPEVLQQCGNKHTFKGKICATRDNTNVRFPTFILENVRVSEGNWYFCVKLPVGGLIQIGWATDGFCPGGSRGIGDDLYSWSYDGSRSALYHKQEFSNQFSNIRWKENDICGCGIEINEENINIKYWLNGKLLGIAFSHQQNISSSTTKCNLLPNGSTTTYYPGVTLQSYCNPSTICEFIFSPEDMNNCPLPFNYKPLLMPQIINIENSIVAYPSNAYLVGDNIEDYFYTSRITSSNIFLRDFVENNHLETQFNLDKHQLILSENSLGFPLSIDKNLSSFTITLDFQILTHQQNSIQLLTSQTSSIQIIFDKFEEKTQVVIVFYLKEQQIKVYINNKCQIFNIKLENEIHFYLLPKIDAKISNLAIWKYALSDQHIQRLFTYGIFYVAIDYQQLKEYRKRVIHFSFSENQFSNRILVPFDQPFQQDIWEKKKKQADQNESNYFQSSTIQFYGNKTYLVLEKTNDQWSEYTIIMDILIPNWPSNKDQQISLLKLNSNAQIFITYQGKISIQDDQIEEETFSSLILNQFNRLFITINKKCVQMSYGETQTSIQIDDDQFAAKFNRIELFREIDLTKNTTNDDSLRIQCQSITVLDRCIDITNIDQDIKLPNSSLQKLIGPSLSLISSNLIAIGYQISWIKTVIEQYKTTNIQNIDTILRQHQQQFSQIDLQNQQKRCLKIFSRLNPLIDKDKLENWITNTQIDIDQQIEFILNHWNHFQSDNYISNNNQIESKEDKWFFETVNHLDIHQNIKQWIKDKSTMTKTINNIPLDSNINQGRRLTNWFEDDDEDDDDENENQSYIILPFRQEQIQSNELGNNLYKLVDLNQSEQDQNQRQSIEFPSNSRIVCEHALTKIYARYTIDNMIKIWSNNSINLFPLEKFGDYKFLIKFLIIMDYHFNSHIDQINLLIKSILKSEILQIIENNNKDLLFFHLQNNILIQLIELIIEPTLLNDDYQIILDEQILIKQPNFKFVFKILNIFLELIKDKSILERDKIVEIFFPELLINLLFDLFLLVSTHQSKIFILQIFSTLVQTTQDFILKIQIQNFLFKLLIELSSDLTLNKHFQIALMDLIFLLLMRQEVCLQRTKLPENVQNLFIAIDIINAFNDQTKQKLLPETFFTQLEDISNDGIKLNREDFDKCNKYFDNKADQQLISFIKTNSSLENSFAAFIKNLPNESIPNSTYYEKYSSLSNIPTDCIQLRCQFLYQLNIFIAKILPMVDFNLLLGQSFLTDQIRTAKIFLLYQTKFQLLNESLEKTTIKQTGETLRISFDTLKASENKDKSENTMFYQGYQQLYPNAHIHFRKKARQLWQAIYVGMHSIDQGGPYRDSITQICSDICSTRLSLFILCPNGRTNTGLNRDCWIPNVFPPNKPICDDLKKQYQFVGQLMGLAIRKKHYLDIKLPLLLWKQLLRESITIEDIQAIDIQSFTSINDIENNFEQTISTDASTEIKDLFTSIISELRFEVVSSAEQTYELIPGGRNIPITSNNFKQYLFCYRQYRLNEFQRQIEFIRQGLCSVVPFYFLSFFTPEELEEAICGKGQIDIQLLKRNTQYNDTYDQDSPIIQRFWTVLTDMFNDEQRKLFLAFVWGRNTLPSRDQDFVMKFTINEYNVDDGDVDKALPHSHTCAFSIDLPEYSTVEIMYERLNYAITYCSSIDGDGDLNGEPHTLHLFSDYDE